MLIYYGDGEVRLSKLDDIEVKGFDIRWKGSMTATSELPDSWTIMNKKSRIIGFSLGSFKPEKLFDYEGICTIIKCDVFNLERTFTIEPKLVKVDYWGQVGTKFEDFTQFPEDFDRTNTNGRTPAKTNLYQINLRTGGGEWYFENGTEYSGDYHIHGSGEAMTLPKHSTNSVSIYRKDARGNLFMLNGGGRSRTTPTITPRITPSGGGY